MRDHRAMNDGLRFALFETTVGPCALVWDAAGQLRGTSLPAAGASATGTRVRQRFGAHEAVPPPAVQAVVGRVQALLRGTHDDLADIALDMAGVPAFDQRVYLIARAIKPGSTLTYGEVAARLGEPPQAAQRVGRALGDNPFPILVPCHRVLAAGGRGGGFSAPGGTRTKLRLLEIERAPLGGAPGLFDA